MGLVYVAVGSVGLLFLGWLARSVVKARRGVRQFRDVVRSHQGLCGTCGYDMRGTPGRCPECGSIPRWTAD